ncbi:Psf2-domain-containing protein [Fomitopsis betulina]|nr:Psf2-domain-containing protein [Fomitopsis betulina]
MALPPPLRTSITPSELELIACEQLIEIIPLVAMERTAFISGAYGPLRPPTKCKVPIWMATNLKLKKKCHIVPPDWLNVDFLQDRLTRETTQPEFSKLPFRFVEIAKVLLDVASDDITNPEKVRSLLQDIREARQAKSREGISKIDHSELSLPNLCAMEINEIRPFFVRSMGVLTQLVRPLDPDQGQMEGMQ